MQRIHLCILVNIRIKGEVGTVKHVPFQGGASFVDPFYCLCLSLLYCLVCSLQHCDHLLGEG